MGGGSQFRQGDSHCGTLSIYDFVGEGYAALLIQIERFWDGGGRGGRKGGGGLGKGAVIRGPYTL